MLRSLTYVRSTNIESRERLSGQERSNMTSPNVKTFGHRKRGRYHHGDLRSALVEAAYHLIRDRGVDGFSLADACRMAEVSTAAPYRHFADRDALIGAVCARGFDQLTEQLQSAKETQRAGSLEAIVAIGLAYVRFVTRDPELFHLMWSTPRHRYHSEETQRSGGRCFGVLLEAVDAFREDRSRRDIPTLSIALPLWTMVHGTASLILSERIEGVAPNTDIDALVHHATRAILNGRLADQSEG